MSSFSEWLSRQRNIEDNQGREYPGPLSGDLSNNSNHDDYWITNEAGEMVGVSAAVGNPWSSCCEGMLSELAPANTGLTIAEPCDADWRLSISDELGDKYKEMEKRVESQDKTISELKSIIEDLQGIVDQKKLDKEAETLVL